MYKQIIRIYAEVKYEKDSANTEYVLRCIDGTKNEVKTGDLEWLASELLALNAAKDTDETRLEIEKDKAPELRIEGNKVVVPRVLKEKELDILAVTIAHKL